ncbi:MAG: RluA family pseudouridine synthase, partial [Treponema sp.]|nr:RluA family pseudouridine synthase [Treponema sp.]
MPSYAGRIGEDVRDGVRLDRYIAESLKLLSRSQIKARRLTARINGGPVKISRMVRGGEALELFWEEAESPDLIPEEIPLDIIYEDERVIAINKAQGMVVHPGAGNGRGTLVNALLFYGKSRGWAPGGTTLRPGIVHRLDKDTSGVLIAAWDEEALAFLAGQFQRRLARKTYAAVVKGTPGEREGRIETLICRDPGDRKRFTVSDTRGKPGLTWYRVMQSYGSHSLLLLRPRTGRTHQLRVHLRHLGHPILGDPLYGSPDPRFPQATLMLHARTLSVTL